MDKYKKQIRNEIAQLRRYFQSTQFKPNPDRSGQNFIKYLKYIKHHRQYNCSRNYTQSWRFCVLFIFLRNNKSLFSWDG
ncbi:hypothetical protein pb186bvf_010643 [Paramecium bursaria]